ncbi:MAG TPA: zinc ribbon domain-containing protein [Pyrinomonadaceae bacterium]
MNSICQNCSAHLSASADFCANCGTLVNVPKTQCLKCRQQIDATASFCNNCGASFVPGEQSRIITQPSNSVFQSPPVVAQEQGRNPIVALGIFVGLGLGIVLSIGFLLTSKGNQSGQFNANVNLINDSQGLVSSNKIFNSPVKQRNVSENNTSLSTSSLSQNSSISEEVSTALSRWKLDAEALNFSAYMNNYADTVDYYRAGQVERSRVSKDKQRAFRLYNSINIGLNNIRIMPDAEGNKATVIVDKSWHFEGNGKTTEGEVQQQLTLKKSSGYWYITGEKDLKVYYSRSY